LESDDSAFVLVTLKEKRTSGGKTNEQGRDKDFEGQ